MGTRVRRLRSSCSMHYVGAAAQTPGGSPAHLCRPSWRAFLGWVWRGRGTTKVNVLAGILALLPLDPCGAISLSHSLLCCPDKLGLQRLFCSMVGWTWGAALSPEGAVVVLETEFRHGGCEAKGGSTFTHEGPKDLESRFLP